MRLACYIILLVTLLAISATGRAQSESENQKKNFQNLLRRALDGEASGMNEVGVALSEGKGTTPNQREAVVWFRRAAELGLGRGAGNVGLHYVRGQGVKRDKVLAAKWFMICHALDGLSCHPSDFLDELKLKKRQHATAWQAAILWLRARPDLKNSFGERPWFGKNGYPVTYRTR